MSKRRLGKPDYIFRQSLRMQNDPPLSNFKRPAIPGLEGLVDSVVGEVRSAESDGCNALVNIRNTTMRLPTLAWFVHPFRQATEQSELSVACAKLAILNLLLYWVTSFVFGCSYGAIEVDQLHELGVFGELVIGRLGL